jgi:putative ATPase
VGYDYPHDDPRGWVRQQYLPDEARDAVYYQPSGHGYEQEIAERMERLAERRDERDDGRGAP